MYAAYTGTKIPLEGGEDSQDSADEVEAKDINNTRQKYDIRKQIRQLNDSNYAKYEGLPKHLLH